MATFDVFLSHNSIDKPWVSKLVDGVQVQGADEKLAREMLELAKGLQTGGISAGKDIVAGNIVTGFQYLGRFGEPDQEQFRPDRQPWPPIHREQTQLVHGTAAATSLSG